MTECYSQRKQAKARKLTIHNRTVHQKTGTEQVVAMKMLYLNGDIVRIDQTKTQQSTKWR